ncbi:MAG: metallophosphoesterase [Thiotrichales bacterium]
MSPYPPACRIVQLTDLHLFEQAHGHLDWHDDCRDINTDRTLDEVLSHLRRHEPRIDAIVVTGDIAQTPTALTYRRFAWIMAATGRPVFCVPGNHDDASLMFDTLAAEGLPQADHALLGGWLLLFLNSAHPGHSAGYLAEAAIARCEALLRQYAEVPTLLFLHHQPLPIGSAWIDRIGLVNGDELVSRLAAFPQIRGAVFGHIHQAIDAERRSWRLLGTPSTCIQFAPDRDDHAYDQLPPAYRRIALDPQGGLLSEVVYTEPGLRGPRELASESEVTADLLALGMGNAAVEPTGT